MRLIDFIFTFPSDEPEFVEWGYGGMGSVKSAASSGADNRWSRVTGHSSFGGGSGEVGWSKERGRGRVAKDDDDDGSGLAWVKKRREQREREKKEREAQEAADKENGAQSEAHAEAAPCADAADPDPPRGRTEKDSDATVVEEPEEAKGKQLEEADPEKAASVVSTPDAEHVTTAVTVPARAAHGHHRSGSMTIERVPSIASHILPMPRPERRGSQDTARATSPAPERGSAEQINIMGELDEDITEGIAGPRDRRASASSSTSASNTEDEGDADTEESPKEPYAEDDDEDDEDEVSTHLILTLPAYMLIHCFLQIARLTARGAGVEKISRHKDKAHSQDGTTLPV